MDQERNMYTGNWTCDGCGGAISQLPFEPREGSALKCLDCFKASKPAGGPSGERQMFSGDWKCSKCGNAITQLPFQPRDESNLTCRDCFMASKA